MEQGNQLNFRGPAWAKDQKDSMTLRQKGLGAIRHDLGVDTATPILLASGSRAKHLAKSLNLASGILEPHTYLFYKSLPLAGVLLITPSQSRAL